MTTVAILAGALAVALGGFLLLRGRNRSERAETLYVAPGVSVKVVETVDPDSDFLCSKCYRTYPISKVHVVPTFNDSLGKYVGSYRCENDWKDAIAETRSRFVLHKSDDEAAAILEVFFNRGVSEEELKRFVAGKRSDEGVMAALDAVENGKITLSP